MLDSCKYIYENNQDLDYSFVADIIVTGFLASIIVPVLVFLLLEMVT